MMISGEGDSSPYGYRSLSHRIRPARVVTAMQVREEGGEHSMLRMLENYSLTWGGAGNLLIPINQEGGIHAGFWPLVEMLDADIWAWFFQTLGGYRAEDSDGFERWLQTACENWVKKHGVTLEEARDSFTSDRILSDPIDTTGLPDDLVEEIKNRTGPALRAEHLMRTGYRPFGFPGRPLVNVLDLRPLPQRVLLFNADNLPMSLRLLLAARFGALSDQHLLQVERAGVSAERIDIGEGDLRDILPFCWLGKGSYYRSGNQALAAARDASRSDHDFVSSGPSSLSLAGCVSLRRSGPFEYDVPITVVVGSQARDFAYAHALEKCGAQALWLPGDFVSGDDDLSRQVLAGLVASIREILIEADEQPPLELCSLSVPAGELGAVEKRLRGAWPGWARQGEIRLVEEAHRPPSRLPLIADARWYDEALEEPFRNEAMQRGAPVVVPSRVRAEDPWKITWWVDIEDHAYRFPARAVLNDLVTPEEKVTTCVARSSREGISFYSHTMWFVPGGAPLRQMVERPRLRFPSVENVFRHLLNNAGYTMSESPEGQFRRLTTALWGGREPLHQDITHEGTFALIRAWLSGESSEDDPGVYTNRKVRYLSLEDGAAASGMATDQTRRKLDRYLQRGIVKRGHCLKCRHCLSFDWYALEEIGQTFRCHRCSTHSPITFPSWKGGGDEPPYYYDLAEVARQAFGNHIEVPSRALAELAAESRSFHEMPNVEVHQDGKNKIEIDLWALVDGKIVIGEAKSGDRIKKTAREEQTWLDRLANLTEAITADEVVFATTTTWREATRTRIENTFQNHPTTPRLLQNI